MIHHYKKNKKTRALTGKSILLFFIITFTIIILIAPFNNKDNNYSLHKSNKYSFFTIRKVRVNSEFYFDNTDKLEYITLNNISATFYSRGDGYTPGITTRSGRFVYEGAIAISRPMLKFISFGDLIYVERTNRWYKVEDTLSDKYKDNRIDIYTHDMDMANSGAFRTNIVILKLPKEFNIKRREYDNGNR